MRAYVHMITGWLVYCDQLTAEEIEKHAAETELMQDENGDFYFMCGEYRIEAENGVIKREFSYAPMEKGWYEFPDDAFPIPESVDDDVAYMPQEIYHQWTYDCDYHIGCAERVKPLRMPPKGKYTFPIGSRNPYPAW